MKGIPRTIATTYQRICDGLDEHGWSMLAGRQPFGKDRDDPLGNGLMPVILIA